VVQVADYRTAFEAPPERCAGRALEVRWMPYLSHHRLGLGPETLQVHDDGGRGEASLDLLPLLPPAGAGEEWCDYSAPYHRSAVARSSSSRSRGVCAAKILS
jgi:hypothetical protein